MAISLRPTEKILMSAKIHWVSYFGPGCFTLICLLGSIAIFSERGPSADVSVALLIFFIGIPPMFLRFLSNACTKYVITNERLYLENGIVAKRKRDIPLNKINDIELTQGIIQRMLGSGSILILTGNDMRTVLNNIASSDKFKDEISKVLGMPSEDRNKQMV